MKKIVFFALLVAFSFSCEQEEEPVVDTRPGTNNPTQPVPTVPDTTDVPGDTVPNNGGGDGVEPSKPIEIDRSIKSVSLSFEVGYANQIFFDLERGQLISEIEKDSTELYHLQNTTEAQEKFAREKFLMRKENEDVFIIRSKKDE